MVKKDRLLELTDIENITTAYSNVARINVEETITYKNKEFPIYSFAFGSTEPQAPTMLFVGGVHGLERVGSQIVSSYLRTVCELAKWDKFFQHQLKDMRILFYPLVNPAGMYAKTRSNPNGVDLMRNAPISAEKSEVFPIVGGHRLGSFLPWYRGQENLPMEKEAQTLCNFVRREIFASKMAVSVDVHSGFGLKDRLWFPLAKTKQPFDKATELYQLKNLLDRTYPSHVYQVEPQSINYVTHGDLWDYLYEEHSAMKSENFFIPLSLELGSWVWVKKNPRQILSPTGAFNPILPHRRKRAFRRHIVLFDFLTKAVASPEQWTKVEPHQRESLHADAVKLWYKNAGKK